MINSLLIKALSYKNTISDWVLAFIQCIILTDKVTGLPFH
jgi:hypothetical protein